MIQKIIIFLKNLFVKNYKVKIVCLLLAFILWLFVASNQSLLGKFPNKIPVKINNLSDQYQAFLDQDEVQITGIAESSVWKTLTTDSFIASVNLSGYQEGTFEVPVSVVSSVADVQITKVEPNKVFVTIEKIVSKNISLGTKVEGDPADGMTLGQIELNPSEVKISGPKSYVDSISEVNALINLNGEGSSFERLVKVQAVAENDKALSGLTYNPVEVNAQVSILKGGNNKTVGIKVKTKNSPPDGYYISKISCNPQTIDITGQRSILAGVNYLETEELDLNNITDVIRSNLSLILPSGVSLQKGNDAKVQVEITVSRGDLSRSINPRINFSNLSDGLKVATYSPQDIRIIVAAPASILESISSDEITLNVNLSGRNAGNYMISLTVDMVKVPDGITVLSVVPTSLNITISN